MVVYSTTGVVIEDIHCDRDYLLVVQTFYRSIGLQIYSLFSSLFRKQLTIANTEYKAIDGCKP